AGAVVDVAAPGSTIANLRIVGGRAAIVVRAAGTTVTRTSISKADVGVFVGDAASDVRVEQSTFDANRIGLQVTGGGLVTAPQNRFSKQAAAGVWAAMGDTKSAAHVVLVDNTFRSDATGVVLVGLSAEVERNVFEDVTGDAIYAAVARIVVKGNTLKAGQ